jgi:DNA polymerase/3'-5' exonuclease PolX
MTSKTLEKQRWPLAQADQVGQEVLGKLSDSCQLIVIAGSVRRRRPDVGDVELLCVSHVDQPNVDLFGTATSLTQGHLRLDRRLLALIEQEYLAYRLDKRGRRSFGVLNKSLIHVPSGISLDVFTGTVANWGRDLLIRTGSADFNKRVMTRFQQLGQHGHAYGPYAVTGPKGRFEAPQEEDMFRHLEWKYIEPEART